MLEGSTVESTQEGGDQMDEDGGRQCDTGSIPADME